VCDVLLEMIIVVPERLWISVCKIRLVMLLLISLPCPFGPVRRCNFAAFLYNEESSSVRIHCDGAECRETFSLILTRGGHIHRKSHASFPCFEQRSSELDGVCYSLSLRNSKMKHLIASAYKLFDKIL
jgi:hypothetical protein